MKDYEYIKLIKPLQDKKEGEIVKVDTKTAQYLIKQEIGIMPNETELIDEEEYDIIQDMQKTILKEERKEKIRQKIRQSQDYEYILSELLYETPIFYDKNKIWWLWNENDNKYEIVDDVDILNLISESTNISNVGGKKKTEILTTLQMIGRKNKPQTPPKHWIQFKNYIYDIITQEKTLPSSKYFFTNPINWNIGENHETPKIDELFTSWVGEKYVTQLYEIIAYCLYRDYPIHRLFCLIGGGRNGKSKFLGIIKNFIGGENTTTTELDLLANPNNRFESAKLYKKLVCLLGETNYNDLKNTGLLKKLTGQDMIGYEFKNKNPFDDINYAKVIIATNSLPITHDKTDGFYRRWMIIDFPNQFKEGKDILKEIPDKEYENLALKCVNLLPRLLNDGNFTNELSIEDKQKMYEEKSNPLRAFIKKYCVEDVNAEIPFYEFKEIYLKFLSDNGYMKISDVVIGRNLRVEGFEISNPKTNRNNPEKNCKYILGIDIKNDFEEDKSTQSTQSTQIPTYFSYIKLIQNLVDSVERVDFTSIMRFLRSFSNSVEVTEIYAILDKMKEKGEIVEIQKDVFTKL